MIYSRSLIAVGLAGFLVAGGWAAVISLSHGAQAEAGHVALQTFYACPEGGPAHVRGCAYVDWGRTDLITLPGPQAVKASDLEPCEHCLRGELLTRTASARSQPPAPAETGLPQTRNVAD